MAAGVLPGAARIVRREEASGEVGLSVENITEAQLRGYIDKLEAGGVRVLDRIRISDF